ncbi:MAG: hypothetical protein ACP5OP_08760 [Leptospirillia bacterium]
MDPFSPDLLRDFLPPDHPDSLPLSFLHPGALVLFSERVTYQILEGLFPERLLIALTNDGAVFLPLPPRSFFDPCLSPRGRGESLQAIFSRLSGLFPASPPPFLENCPGELRPEGPFRVEAGDEEVVLAASRLLSPRGNSGRTFRWEHNRLERQWGPTGVRRIRPEDEEAVRSLLSAFVDYRRSVARDSLEREMASDMAGAFGRAMDPRWRGDLEGWLLEGRGELLAVGWYGRSASGRVLSGFLEARRVDLSNAGASMMRKILETDGTGGDRVEWVNIGGGAGIGGVEKAKKTRPTDRILPLFRVRPP